MDRSATAKKKRLNISHVFMVKFIHVQVMLPVYRDDVAYITIRAGPSSRAV